MKIGLVCSHGGHLTEMLQILEVLHGHDFFFITYHNPRENEIRKIAPSYFTNNIGTNVWRMIRTTFWAWPILRYERPQVLISTGAEIALPFFYFGKILGIKLIYIEGFFSVSKISKTGRLVYPIVHKFYVQWPQLVNDYGPKAEYHGSVL